MILLVQSLSHFVVMLCRCLELADVHFFFFLFFTVDRATIVTASKESILAMVNGTGALLSALPVSADIV